MKPQDFVVAVIVENDGGGSSAAAPVARQVFDAYLLKPVAETQGRDQDKNREKGRG